MNAKLQEELQDSKVEPLVLKEVVVEDTPEKDKESSQPLGVDHSLIP